MGFCELSCRKTTKHHVTASSSGHKDRYGTLIKQVKVGQDIESEVEFCIGIFTTILTDLAWSCGFRDRKLVQFRCTVQPYFRACDVTRRDLLIKNEPNIAFDLG